MSSVPTAAPAANAAAAFPAGGSSPAVPSNSSSNTRRNYYRRNNNNNSSAANDSAHDSANRVIKNEVFDIGATASPDQFRRTLQAIENYVQTNYKEAGDLVIAIRNLAPPPALIPPTVPTLDPNNPLQIKIDLIHYDVAYKAHAAAEHIYKSHLVNAWGLIYGQCTTALKSKLDGLTEYITAQQTHDIIALLQIIQGLCCKFDIQSQKYVALAATVRQMYVYFQDTLHPTRISSTTTNHFSAQFKRLGGTMRLESFRILSTMSLLLSPPLREPLSPLPLTIKNYARR